MKKGFYKHYIGGKYELLFTGLLEKDLSEVAIYQGEDGRIWVRDLKEFEEKFTHIL